MPSPLRRRRFLSIQLGCGALAAIGAAAVVLMGRRATLIPERRTILALMAIGAIGMTGRMTPIYSTSTRNTAMLSGARK
jgi:hypothetical protein